MELVQDPRMEESGLLGRFDFLISDYEEQELDYQERTICKAVSDAYNLRLTELIYLRDLDKPLRVEMPETVRRMFIDFQNELRLLKLGKCRDIRDFLVREVEKAKRCLLRWHAVIHGAQCHTIPLDEKTTADCISIQRWYLKQRLAVLAPKRAQLKVEVVQKLELLLLQHKGVSTENRLKKDHGFPNAEAVAQSNPERFAVQYGKGPGGRGKDSITIRLLPQAA